LLIAAQLGELNHDEDFAHQPPVVHATASLPSSIPATRPESYESHMLSVMPLMAEFEVDLPSTSRTSEAKYREFVIATPESLRQNSMKGLAEMRPKGLRVADEMTGELCAMIEPLRADDREVKMGLASGVRVARAKSDGIWARSAAEGDCWPGGSFP
jgi:hypothetical protein